MATESDESSLIQLSTEATQKDAVSRAVNDDDAVSRSSFSNTHIVDAEGQFPPSPLTTNGTGYDLDNQCAYPLTTATTANSATTLQSTQNSSATDQNRPDFDSRELWTSFWLRKCPQLGFVLVFTSLWIACVLIMHYNIVESGFSLTFSSNHYSWTYGPTVVLTIIVSLWRQVDYNCKLHQPWREMRKGPTTSDRSVLLDYVSPLQAMSLWRSLSNRHYAVSASIVGFVALKGIVVASTTLLVSSITTSSSILPITITTKFNAVDYVKTLTPQEGVFVGDSSTPLYNNTNDTATSAYQGLSVSEFQHLANIQDQMVFQTFNYSANGTNLLSLTGSVEAFTPNITCEEANITNINISLSQADVVVDSPSCSVGNHKISIWNSCDNLRAENLIVQNCQLYQVHRINCSTDIQDSSDVVTIDDKTPYDLRFLLFATDLRDVAKTWDDSFEPKMYEITRSTAVVCKIDYFIQDIIWTKTPADDSLTLNPSRGSAPNHHLPGLTGLQLGEIIYAILYDRSRFSEESDNWDPIFKLMRLASRSPTEVDFFNADNMKRSFVTAFGGLACQLAQLEFLIPDRTMAEGHSISIENKLHIQSVSVWLMIAGFILLSLIALAMIFSAPRRTHSQDPSLLASYGIVLASSLPSMKVVLENTGSLRTSELTKWLENIDFNTVLTSRGIFRIEARTRQGLSDHNPITDKLEAGTSVKREIHLGRVPSDMKVKKGAWVPLFASIPMVILTLLLPLGAIVGLEILYQNSERSNGIVDVDNTPIYYIRYPSSIAALLIATLFNSLDFTISAFASFNALRMKAVSMRRGLVTNLLEVMPPVALYHALLDHYFGAFMSIIAALIGSTLTIIVSGLWVVDSSVVISTEIIAPVANTWDLSWANSSYNDAAVTDHLIGILTNSSLPPFGIWNDLVLPEITGIFTAKDMPVHSKLNLLDPKARENLTYTLDMPALRPKLRCEAVTKIDIPPGIEPTDFMIPISATYPLPRHCHGGPGGNRTYGIMTTTVPNDVFGIWFGEVMDLHMGPWNESNPAYGEITSGAFDDLDNLLDDFSLNTNQPDNPDGCPSIGILAGRIQYENISVENVTGMYCFQEVQHVQTSIVFDYDGTENQTAIKFGHSNIRSPPLVNESTAISLSNGTQGIDSFHYRIIEHFVGLPFYWVMPEDYNKRSRFRRPDQLNDFFKTLTFTPGMPTLDAMLGPTNTQVLVDAVERLYKIYMVLVINSPIFRKPFNDSAHSLGQQQQQEQQDLQHLVGSVSTTVSRLKVDFISKLILQISLATMTILGGLGFLLTNIRGTLSRNPFSIASLMSLFAGSQFCKRDNLPAGAEWMSRQELVKAFRGWRFSLGWWEVPDTTRVLLDDLLETDEEETLRFGIGIGSPKYRGYARKGNKAE